MKILVVHNLHRSGSASGDDQVFKSETSLLEQHGHTVIRYTVRNDSFDQAGPLGKLTQAFGMRWSFKHAHTVRRLILEEKPDIVHVHTFFPLLSPSVIATAKKLKVPVVATLHDTRFICPCATSLRGNSLCNECGNGHYFRMVRYGCFKGSRLQSLVVAFIFSWHRFRRTFYRCIDRYICLNDNQMQLLEQIDFDRNRMIKKYNFVPDAEACLQAADKSDTAGLPERYAVYYGRLGEEKGIRFLMKCWEQLPDIPLVVMGGGPLEEVFSAWAGKHPQVRYLGYTEHQKCLRIVKGGEFVVFPSIWYEGCSMVEIEAESLGRPLIATDLGFSKEAITDGVNGRRFSLGDADAFVAAVRSMWADPEGCRRMGQNARLDYERKYRPEDNYQQLLAIYQNAAGFGKT